MEMIKERKVGGVVEADLPRMKGGDPAVWRVVPLEFRNE